jgi:hypothetical protein
MAAPDARGCPLLAPEPGIEQIRRMAELKKIITEGKGKMKPVKAVSGAAVDDVVAYVRTFKQ